MEHVVLTVEAVRCYHCQRPLSPQEPFERRQMKTAVEVGSRTGLTAHYELVNLCVACAGFYANVEHEERNRLWWRKFWIWAVIANMVLMATTSYTGVFPLYVAIFWRNAWKWKQKRAKGGRQFSPISSVVVPPGDAVACPPSSSGSHHS